VAKKIFEVVPIQEAWPANQIQGALQQVTRSTMDFTILKGCLNTLKAAGLVREPRAGHFQRMQPKDPPTPIRKDMTEIHHIDEYRKPPGVVEILNELAGRARTLAADLDAAAAMIAEEAEKNAADLHKLAQLQAAFRSLS
jgi:hypothetical protein